VNRHGPNTPSLRSAAPTVLLVAAISVYYLFESTVGTFANLSWHTDYYDLLAEGFAHGHVYLPVNPDPELLRQADPYDYAHVDLWLWDVSLYAGKYYLYWGPAPALCLLAFKSLFGVEGQIYDQWLVLAFMLGRLYAGALLILGVARLSRLQPSHWPTLLAIAVFGLASPTPYFMARPVIYEASIAGGQCFLFWGLLAAYWGTVRPRQRLWSFALAGLCWGMALGSRGSLILVAPTLVVITAFAAERGRDFRWQPILRNLLALGLPVALSLGLYALYNELRFDSFAEFGLKYQLTWRPFTGANRYLLPNLFSYAAAELRWSCQFPFVRIPLHQTLSQLIHWPHDYDVGDYGKGERVAGLFAGTLFCWLLFAWPLRAWLRLREIARGASASPLVRIGRVELWLLLCSIALLLAMLPASRMYMANMRFLEDGVGGPLLAAILAGFWLLRRTRDRERVPQRWLARTAYIGLAALTMFVGVALGFSGHFDNFENSNGELFDKLVAELSLCRPASDPRE
jgi:hypothetical protein